MVEEDEADDAGCGEGDDEGERLFEEQALEDWRLGEWGDGVRIAPHSRGLGEGPHVLQYAAGASADDGNAESGGMRCLPWGAATPDA